MFPITFQSEFISTSNPSTFEQNTLQLSLVTVYILKETKMDSTTFKNLRSSAFSCLNFLFDCSSSHLSFALEFSAAAWEAEH